MPYGLIDGNTAALMYYVPGTYIRCRWSSVINEEYVRLFRFSANRFKPAKNTDFFPPKYCLLAYNSSRQQKTRLLGFQYPVSTVFFS